jgi:hypothetical protein
MYFGKIADMQIYHNFFNVVCFCLFVGAIVPVSGSDQPAAALAGSRFSTSLPSISQLGQTSRPILG